MTEADDAGAQLVVVRVATDDGRTVRFAVSGEVDLLAAPLLTAQVHTADPFEGDLVLDTTGVTFLDSSGVSALLRLRDERLAVGATLVLLSSPAVRRTIEAAGLGDLFGLAPEGGTPPDLD